MRRHAKATPAGSTQRQAAGLGRIIRGALAGRAPSLARKESGAPSHRLLLCLSLTLLLAAVCAVPAQAAPTIIAESGRSAGEVESPEGVAVDQSSGDLYVADGNNFRVDKFDSEGNFLLAWGWGVADGISQEFQICGPAASPPTKRCTRTSSAIARAAGAVSPTAVAVDQSSGAVYVADSTNLRVSKFTSSGQFLFMVGKGVDQGGGTPGNPGNICTAEYLENGDTCGRGASGTGPNEFSSPRSLAIDSSGVVWVGDTNRIKSFDSAGTYVSEASIAAAGATKALGIDPASGDFYAISASLAGARRYEPSGAPINTLTLTDTLDATESPQGLGVDSAGNVYVGDCGFTTTNTCPTPYRLKVFNPAGEQVSQFGAGQLSTNNFVNNGTLGNALAVDESAGALYAAVRQGYVKRFLAPEPGPLPENQHVEDLEPTTATLAADLSPEGHETTYRFDYGTSESYGESTEIETLEESGAPYTGFEGKPVSAGLEGLTPETTYHFHLVAEDSEGHVSEGPDTAFTTLPAVQIGAQWATAVAATDVLLHAELNPLGPAASWWVEYGQSEEYESSTPPQLLAAGSTSVSRSVQLGGLKQATTYHYRFAARDERDGQVFTSHGEDHVFMTQVSGLGFQLPDGRGWELVSPVDKMGGEVTPPIIGVVRASTGGDGLTYQTLGTIEAAPQGNRLPENSQVLARHGEGGWRSEDITTPNDTAVPAGPGLGPEYRFFSPNLSAALVEPHSGLPLSEEASERTPYLRDNTAEPATYRPLVTSKEGFANVPPGTEFGGDPLTSPFGKVNIVGSTPDLSHVVVESGVSLAAGVPKGSLYEWAAGTLQVVSVLPAGEGGAMAEGGELGAGTRTNAARNAVSADGRYVFWSRENNQKLYLRDTASAETVRLDVVQPGAFGAGKANPVFQGADAAGTVAFFTDTQQLTEDANESGADLYRCEVTTEGGELGCALSDVSAATPDPGESAAVRGLLSGMSEDATQIYFVAQGVLAPGAQPGKSNLYAMSFAADGGEWQTRFIATLSSDDVNDAPLNLNSLSAASSPNGRYFAFMSERSLTGYDNRDALSGIADQEVYLFDAATAEVVCVSCNPSGARPDGQEITSRLAIDPGFIWNKRWLSGVLPDPNLNSVSFSPSQPRFILDNGRVFFNSHDALVPADSNGNWDVYEYEPTGVGGCEASSGGASVSRTEGGCVALLSAGTSVEESAFQEASASGDDVFFFTVSKLFSQDVDTSPDIYDAHVCGAGWQCQAPSVPSPPCEGDACLPAVVVPNDPTPASSNFDGPGNVREAHCPKGKRKVRRKGKVRCVARHHRKRSHKTHKKSQRGGASKRSNSVSSAPRAKTKHSYRANANRGGAK